MKEEDEEGYEMSLYVEGFKQRLKRAQQKAAEEKKRAEEDLKKCVEFLKKNKDIKKVYLFGSLLWERFSADSDIDLAVEGLKPEDFFHTRRELSKLTNREIDLITLDDYQKDDFFQLIRQRGRVLYDKS